MADVYTGKCELKNWEWRPLRYIPGEIPDLRVGETFARLETLKGSGFEDVHTPPPKITSAVDTQVLELRTEFSESRSECIEMFKILKDYIESQFPETDRALLVTRKSPKQLQILKAGQK